MFQVRRNRRGMEQRTDPPAAQFLRPKLAEMIEWELNRHAGNLFESVVAAFVSNAEPRIGAWHKRLYNFLRKMKIAAIASAVTPAQTSANHSPWRV